MRKKIYGSYQTKSCPFCGNTATTANPQKIPVCQKHKSKILEDIKCACGEWLDIKSGKFGAYFYCINCKNISLEKGLSMIEFSKNKTSKENNANNKVRLNRFVKKDIITSNSDINKLNRKVKKIIDKTITSDDPDFF
jgi:hypothetical protein